MSAQLKVTLEINLGRFVPDKTKTSQPVFCALPGGRALVTIPFVVYGEERAKRLKPGFFIAADGTLSRAILPGLGPEATVFDFDDRGIYFAWTDANRRTAVGTNDSGRTVWRQRMSGLACARRGTDGTLVLGSVASELRRYDGAGTLLYDLDRVFRVRPFKGAHGVDCLGQHTVLTDADATHSVWVLDTMGNPGTRIGSNDPALNQAGKGLLCHPLDVVVMDSGRIVVAEEGRRRLAVFRSDGKPSLTVSAADLGAEEICTSRIFANRDRTEAVVIGRRAKELWVLGFAA